VFYLTWFFKLYRVTDTGWEQVKTPDDKSFLEQDAFFQQCLDCIGRKLNIMLSHERWKMAQRGQGGGSQ
jgi:hypothetical protein